MNIELPKLSCPVCNTPISVDNKHWIIQCSSCGKEIQIVHDNGKVVSVRRYISLSYLHDKAFIDYVEKNLPLEKWGFSKTFQPQEGNMVIYDSEFCRVKFELSQKDYYPMYDTQIYYGRLHAPDKENRIQWNGENCLCWHSNILGLAIPFIERIPLQQLVENYTEIWQSLVKPLNVDYPSSDYIEYPLRLHSKIWEHYGEKLFFIFDMRNPELWEKYSAFSNEYNDLHNEILHKKYDISCSIERIC